MPRTVPCHWNIPRDPHSLLRFLSPSICPHTPPPPTPEMKKKEEKRNHIQWVKTYQAVEEGLQEVLKVWLELAFSKTFGKVW